MNDLDFKIKSEFENLPANFWDFKASSTRDLTHGLHNYPATMVYPISKNIIQIMSKYINISSLLDPFMGSGTVLIEGMLANIPSIYGTDLNPLSVLISKVKTTPLNNEQLDYIEKTHLSILNTIITSTNKIADEFNGFVRNNLDLDITLKKGWGDAADKYVKQYFKLVNKSFSYQSFNNLGFWFTPRTVIILQVIKDLIKKVVDIDVKNFLMVVFSETVRNVSNTRNGEFKLFRMRAEKVAVFAPDVFKEYVTILKRNLSKMIDFTKAYSNNVQININYDDAKILRTISKNSIDLIITSPPYGDSRTTVAYGQFSRLSLQWLDLDYTNQADISSIDKNLLGGIPYCNKEQWGLLESKTLVDSLEKIAKKDLLRADDVFSFYLDLDKCLYSITSKMKPNSYQFWVVGNRTVKLEKLYTDKILSEIAVKYGLKYLFSFNRNILNKVMPSENSPTNEVGERAKTMTKEIIVVLKKD